MHRSNQGMGIDRDYVPLQFTPIGPPHPPRDPENAAAKGRAARRMKATRCGLKRFSWETDQC